MRKLQQFCPQCGTRVDRLIENVCEKCYAEGKRLVEVPERLAVKTCPQCGKLEASGEWIDVEGDPRLIVIGENLRVNGHAKIDVVLNDKGAHITADGYLLEVPETPVHEEYDVTVKHAKKFCDNCSRARGGYYEAVLQIRSQDERKVKRVLLVVEAVVEHPRGKYWFIMKTANVRGGVDVYLGSRVMLTTLKKRIEEDMGKVETKLSHELFGQVGGKEVYRHVLVVRV